MDTKKALAILKKHQAWRRGEKRATQQCALEVGEALDVAIDHLSNDHKRRKRAPNITDVDAIINAG